MEITLVQPRHIYAPNNDHELGHIYMPTSLLSVASRLLMSGVEVRFFDENIRESNAGKSDIIGINLIGAPYVNSAKEIIERYKKKDLERNFIVGGQGVRGFADEQFHALFGHGTYIGNKREQLEHVLGLDSIQNVESITLIPALNLLSDDDIKLYLSTEFCFYLSQGCRFQCSFCAAEHTLSNSKRITESYRSMDKAYAELMFICDKAIKFSINELNIYLSNLDLFQSPFMLEQFSDVLVDVKKRYNGMKFNFRGLSTVHSFLQCHKKNSSLVRKLVFCGLDRIGFGIDGASPSVWKSVKKPQNHDQCIRSILIASREYNVTPESLMVFGHNNADTKESLDDAIRFVEETMLEFNCIPRPHVAKSLIPGNEGWLSAKNIVKYLLSNPSQFQMLDFTTIPSWLTHPNEAFRELVTSAFLTICSYKESLTMYTIPEDIELPEKEFLKAKEFNLRKYDI